MKKVLLATLFSVFASSAMAADLHLTCEDFLKELSADMPAEAKAQIDASRTQYAALSKDQQAAVCKESLDALKSSKKDDDSDDEKEDKK